MNQIQRRQPIKKRSKEFQKLVNQEDLLAEISERLILELKSHNKTEEWLADALHKESSYIDGLIHGFANVSVRELADVFTEFGKIVSLTLLDANRSSRKTTTVIKNTIFSEQSLGIERATLTLESKYHKLESHIDFIDRKSAKEPLVIVEKQSDMQLTIPLHINTIFLHTFSPDTNKSKDIELITKVIK